MPIHDWSRVFPGTFHHFHGAWIVELSAELNRRLPDDYYALAEQHTADAVPDVLTLGRRERTESAEPIGGVLLADAPPQVSVHVHASEETTYRNLRRTITIRHRSGDPIIALIEIVSPGNKNADKPFERFVDKCASAIHDGIHVLLIDLNSPTCRDPHGIHAAVWSCAVGDDFIPPPDRSLTLASYLSEPTPQAFVEPVAVGDVLPDMPVFLDVYRYISVPLESTYMQAFEGVPAFLREILDGNAPSQWE